MVLNHLLFGLNIVREYISTPPMGRTACTEPQCLYKGALYLRITLRLSETSVGFYQNVLRHLAEAGILHSHCRVKNQLWLH
jgi:hypothetical protein